MSYRGTAALQAAVYRVLREDTALEGLVGDAIYDAMPVAAPAGPYVSLGPEEVRDAGDMTAGGAVKAVAVAVSEALETAEIALDRGHLAGLWFLRARARRAENGAGRRVDLTFRARIDLG
ncbi:DUF3168 domain-containing protein [Paracoccus sp. PXZ]